MLAKIVISKLFLLVHLVNICSVALLKTNQTANNQTKLPRSIHEREQRLIIKESVSLGCKGCMSIPCNLASDPTCTLSWFYDRYMNPDLVYFELKLKTPPDSSWIGIAFNADESNLIMIGSNVIMLHFDRNNQLKAYNGYLKHYNAPLTEKSSLQYVTHDSSDGVSLVKFYREKKIKSVNIESSLFDLSMCNYIAVGSGSLLNSSLQTHTDYPEFSSQCYDLTQMPGHKTSTEKALPADNDPIMIIVESSESVETTTNQITSNEITSTLFFSSISSSSSSTSRTTVKLVANKIMKDIASLTNLTGNNYNKIALLNEITTISPNLTSNFSLNINHSSIVPSSTPFHSTANISQIMQNNTSYNTTHASIQLINQTNEFSSTSSTFANVSYASVLFTNTSLSSPSLTTINSSDLIFTTNSSNSSTTLGFTSTTTTWLVNSTYSNSTSFNTTSSKVYSASTNSTNLNDSLTNTTSNAIIQFNTSSLATTTQATISKNIYLINMTLNTIYDTEFSVNNSTKYLNLIHNISKYIRSALDLYDLKGDSNLTDLKIYPSQIQLNRHLRRIRQASRNVNTLVQLSYLLEYYDSTGGNAFDIKRTIKNALKQGDQCLLPVNVDSITIQQIYPVEPQPKTYLSRVDLATIILPSFFGAAVLLSILLFALHFFYRLRQKRSYKLKDDPKIEYINLVRI